MIIQGYCNNTQRFSFLVSDVEQTICLIRSVYEVISVSGCDCWQGLSPTDFEMSPFFVPKEFLISERAVRGPMTSFAARAGAL